MPVWTPKDYQADGVGFLLGTRAAALWWRMGRGKTATTATAVADAIDVGFSGKALVVAPKRVATQTWPNEFKKWDHLSGLRWIALTGSRKQRIIDAQRDADVYLINWEMFPWLVDEFKLRWKWDLLVLDEASKVKNQGTANYKAAKTLRQNNLVSRVVELTGSPAPNGLKDVWAPIYLLDRGRRLGRTQDAFLKRWFYTDRQGQLQIMGKPAQEEINDRLSDIVYALRSAVTGNEPIVNRVMVELPPKAMREYDQLERTAFLQLENEEKITAVNAAAITGKLLQYASGGVYTEHPAWVEVHKAKMEALEDIIEEAQGDPVIVAYHSRHEMERILRAFPQAVSIDQAGDTLEEDWNAKKIPILVMHPQSGGHGLNLQFGGATIVWFSLGWNLEHYEQLIARLHGRHGQARDVIVHQIMAQGTIDEEVDLRLAGKASVQEALMIAAERRRRKK